MSIRRQKPASGVRLSDMRQRVVICSWHDDPYQDSGAVLTRNALTTVSASIKHVKPTRYNGVSINSSSGTPSGDYFSKALQAIAEVTHTITIRKPLGILLSTKQMVYFEQSVDGLFPQTNNWFMIRALLEIGTTDRYVQLSCRLKERHSNIADPEMTITQGLQSDNPVTEYGENQIQKLWEQPW